MRYALENYERIWLPAFPLLLFLMLMLLYGGRIEQAVEPLLARWTVASTIFCLEALGCTVSRDDSFILIFKGGTAMNEAVWIHVARACGGLRIVTVLFVVSVFLAMILRRPWWQNLAVMASSLPIALLCNTIRVTALSLVSTMVKDEGWRWQVFHYGMGYAMAVLGAAAMFAELWLMGGSIVKKKGCDT